MNRHKLSITILNTVFFPFLKMCILFLWHPLYSWGKAVPLQAWSGPEGSRKLRSPDFMTTAQDGGKVVSLTYRPPLPPGNAPGTHFVFLWCVFQIEFYEWAQIKTWQQRMSTNKFNFFFSRPSHLIFPSSRRSVWAGPSNSYYRLLFCEIYLPLISFLRNPTKAAVRVVQGDKTTLQFSLTVIICSHGTQVYNGCAIKRLDR